ncbi:hypothetical protein D2Q93_16735 [Alicyclobacillaceae bacterium I2511]|nr:hypothetical protein D2Q93_16735 [Alicyclobacillaceae bacterium I2511]
MNALSLLTKKSFLASREAHVDVERAMASGELRATASVITSPGAHLYVGDSHVTKTYSQPVAVHDESDALALIRSEELTSQNTKVKLAVEVLDGCPTQQLCLGRYSADADAYWLSFMHDDFSACDDGEGDPFMSEINLSVNESSEVILQKRERVDDIRKKHNLS